MEAGILKLDFRRTRFRFLEWLNGSGLTEWYRNWISWYLDVSPSWCRHYQYLIFLTGAPATNFARKRVQTRYLTLFRATKNCVAICSYWSVYIDFFIWEKFAIDLTDVLRFFAIFCNLMRFNAILCDFLLGNQIRHREKTEEDCKDLLPSMVALLGYSRKFKIDRVESYRMTHH